MTKMCEAFRDILSVSQRKLLKTKGEIFLHVYCESACVCASAVVPYKQKMSVFPHPMRESEHNFEILNINIHEI